MKTKLSNIRPVRNMFKRYGCPTDSLEEVESEYIEGEGQRRLWVRFTDKGEAHEAFELLRNPDNDLDVDVNFDCPDGYHEIILSKPNHHANN